MELKINIDTKAVATQMVSMMVQNLHNSVVTFAHQKFGAINPQAGAMPFPPQGPGVPPFPGAWPNLMPQYTPPFGAYPPPGHPYGPFGMPPAPYAQQQQQQHPLERPRPQAPQPPTEYHRLMDALVTNPELLSKVEEILTVHLQEFVSPPQRQQQPGQ